MVLISYTVSDFNIVGVRPFARSRVCVNKMVATKRFVEIYSYPTSEWL